MGTCPESDGTAQCAADRATMRGDDRVTRSRAAITAAEKGRVGALPAAEKAAIVNNGCLGRSGTISEVDVASVNIIQV